MSFRLDSWKARSMPRSLFVHLIPSLTTPEELCGSTAVVIDVLRASTTILSALDAGAKAVIPCLEVEEARRATVSLPRPVLLGGEREGKKIKGFDLDNSPWNYTRDVCEGSHLVFTTTNGTRALESCREASTIHVGAFSNLSALVTTLLMSSTDIHLVCAGTDGEVTLEDVLFAGAVCQRLMSSTSDLEIGNDAARIALTVPPSNLDQGSLVDLFRVSRGGRNLLELGFERDLDLAAEIDRLSFAATWNPDSNQITRR